jgi:exopolyphosphatase/pppGpp-phosphohydrolase
MKLIGVKTLLICPWALREGILLRYLEDGTGGPTEGSAPALSSGDSTESTERPSAACHRALQHQLSHAEEH